ncbi:hypothetical protein ACJX0J_015570, partial [Zea mays]
CALLGTALHHVAIDASSHGDRATVELPCTVPAYRPPGRPVEDQVTSLKRLCGGTSTFCAIGALVWPCTLVARRLPPDSEARLTFSANVHHYFGNALVRLGATGAVRDVASEALASVAGRIKDAVDR